MTTLPYTISDGYPPYLGQWPILRWKANALLLIQGIEQDVNFQSMTIKRVSKL